MPITSIYDWLYSIISTDFFDSSSKLILINFSLNADVNSSILLNLWSLTAMFILTLFEYVILSFFLCLSDSHSIPQLLPHLLILIYERSLVRLLGSHLLAIRSTWCCCRTPSLYSLSLNLFLGSLCCCDRGINLIWLLNWWWRVLSLLRGIRWIWGQR